MFNASLCRSRFERSDAPPTLSALLWGQMDQMRLECRISARASCGPPDLAPDIDLCLSASPAQSSSAQDGTTCDTTGHSTASTNDSIPGILTSIVNESCFTLTMTSSPPTRPTTSLLSRPVPHSIHRQPALVTPVVAPSHWTQIALRTNEPFHPFSTLHTRGRRW